MKTSAQSENIARTTVSSQSKLRVHFRITINLARGRLKQTRVTAHGELEGAISAASLAELHFGLLVASDPDERARRAQRLGAIEAGFEPIPVDAAVAREWGRLSAAVAERGGRPRRRASSAEGDSHESCRP